MGERRTAAAATVASVNVGAVRIVEWPGQPVTTGIWKEPVDGPVRVRGVNLDGDDQADRSVHDGPDKAVYAYAQEDTAWWAARLARDLGPGSFGENLTTSGLDLADAVVSERWAVGSAVLEVSQPRVPCFKLGIRMGDGHFPRRFAEAARPGAYLRIVREGQVGAGDAIRILSRTAPSCRGSSRPRSWPSRGPSWPATSSACARTAGDDLAGEIEGRQRALGALRARSGAG
jgi:MOSC domain-containing protein YiiM